MSDINNEINGKGARRPFYVRVLDALVPSLITAIFTAAMASWVSLQVMRNQIDDLRGQLNTNTHMIETLRVSYAALQGESNEYVKRLDASLVTQNQISQKLDERITYLERLVINTNLPRR